MKKILAIDDEATIRKLLTVYLGKHYKVTAMPDGLEALKWMQEGNLPDLIICDIQMPNMNGYEFVENIRSSGLFKDIPLLMLSGEEESSTRIKFYKMKVKNFITKPFNPEELLVLIKLILNEEDEIEND
ncbi:MAG TPA: response regulator [Bacteroidia bacterium]|nr:response regulator [Sphingobacteriales bacterium]HPD65316.1 response regulator [Bacteroidia bacterium]HRS58828.1 response regulator [Bacteroidia bacterium]HRU67741.1 response regulator [Bacteroidia bacterium]